MPNNKLQNEINKRQTFAIISHPDAGKTTLTEQLLLFGGAITLAGTVKARKSSRHAASDWMELEKQRGISVTTSVMQFPFKGHILNLLDTPGHADFSEDTYRTLTAVDSALMVIDIAKGVEERTIKLMDVCKMRTTPIITFINKMDRDGKDPISLLDEVEEVLNIKCAPITWPIGMGAQFKGIYNILEDKVYLYDRENPSIEPKATISGLENAKELINDLYDDLLMELELVKGASHKFDKAEYLEGKLTPVYFGSALKNIGVSEMLSGFVQFAPSPTARKTTTRDVNANEEKFSGFVFKVQANMDPKHHDRMAFLRVCSGSYKKGMRLYQQRLGKEVLIGNALTFMAGSREALDLAYPGDIIGLHNHGTIKIGDTFTQGEDLKFIGIPNFAPELFCSVRAQDPLKVKTLQKGLMQLSEEGATQVFRPLANNNIILGAVGTLQFDVVAHRLKYEYKVECVYENINIACARWVLGEKSELDKISNLLKTNLSLDINDDLVYLAPSRVNLSLTIDRYPKLKFISHKEH